MKARRLLIAVLALGAAGCAAAPYVPDVSKIRPAEPLRAKAAFLVESSVGLRLDRKGDVCTLPLDPAEVKRILMDPLLSLQAFQIQEVTEAGGTLDSDLRVSLRILNHRVRFHGRNRWWIPNLVVWFLVLFPSWWIPDETFTADLDVELSVADTRSGKVLFRKEINASTMRHLNDLDRGFSLLAIVDDRLEEENYREAARCLDRALWEKVAPGVLEALGVEFPRELAKAKWAPQGTARALVVGIGEEGCQADAERVAVYLRGPGGIPRENIVLIKAGWEELLQALARNPESRPYERIRKTLDGWKALPFPERDRVFFYFSGQGALTPDGAPAVVAENGGEGRIRVSRVLESMSRFQASTAVIDAGFRPQGGTRSFPGEEKANPEAFARKIDGSRSALILAAPPGAEGLESPKAGTGVCTDYFLKAAQGKADRDGNRETSAGEFTQFLTSQMKGFALIIGREAEPYIRLPDRFWLPSGEK